MREMALRRLLFSFILLTGSLPRNPFQPQKCVLGLLPGNIDDNELTRVFSYNISVNAYESQMLMNAFNAGTLVRTVYWKSDSAQENNTEQGVKKEDVWLDMVCLRNLNMDKAMSNGTPNGTFSMGGVGVW